MSFEYEHVAMNLVSLLEPEGYLSIHDDDGNPARANIKQALGRPWMVNYNGCITQSFRRKWYFSFPLRLQSILLVYKLLVLLDVAATKPRVHVHFDNEYNVFANDREHIDPPKNINDTYLMETIDSNMTPDSSDKCNNAFLEDHNANDRENECVAFANLIANLKLDTDGNKKIQKQLKRANASLTHELNECKSALAKSNDIRNRCRNALYNQEIELEKYKKYKDCQMEKEELECNLKASLDRLAQQKLQIVKVLKMQAYETFEYKEKNVKLVHQSSLEHIHYDRLHK
nr:hypothetical protein [Tanacetum cinerariifolium]